MSLSAVRCFAQIPQQQSACNAHREASKSEQGEVSWWCSNRSAERIVAGEGLLVLDVSQVDRRTGQDWPYTEKQMEEKFALQDPAQQLYPPAGRDRDAMRVRLTYLPRS
jgi:hypothetical protein